MSKVHCMYCGAEIADDVEFCPECKAPSHYQKRGHSSHKQRNFILFFIILTVFTFIMMFWLPR